MARFRSRVLLALLSAVAGCSAGRTQDLSLTFLHSPGEEPFRDVESVRVALVDPALTYDAMNPATKPPIDVTFPYSANRSFDVSGKGDIHDGYVFNVDGLSRSNAIIALGRSLPLVGVTEPATAKPIKATVYVGRSNELGVTAVQPAVARVGATSTLTIDGRVIIAGGATRVGSGPLGIDPASVSSAVDIYDPSTDELTTLSATARALHAAVVLLDGRVLLIGGIGAAGEALASVDVVTFESGVARIDAGIPLPAGRYAHAAALITSPQQVRDEGRILLIGGQRAAGDEVDHAIYDPASASEFATLPSAALSHRSFATATALQSLGGEIFVFGGRTPSSGGYQAAGTYDPATRTFHIPAGASSLPPVIAHSATRMKAGYVFVFGGRRADTDEIVNTALVFGLDAQAIAPVVQSNSASPNPRQGHVAALAGSDVLIFGGADGNGADALDPLRFHPTAKTIATGSSFSGEIESGARSYGLRYGRVGASAATLADGSILVFGGATSANATAAGDLSRLVYCDDPARCAPFNQ